MLLFVQGLDTDVKIFEFLKIMPIEPARAEVSLGRLL
jgi:hypothetical protein